MTAFGRLPRLKGITDGSAVVTGGMIESVAARLNRQTRLSLVARFQEMAATTLFSGEKDADKILSSLETGLGSVRRLIAPDEIPAVSFASLAIEVARTAQQHSEERKRTGGTTSLYP